MIIKNLPYYINEYLQLEKSIVMLFLDSQINDNSLDMPIFFRTTSEINNIVTAIHKNTCSLAEELYLNLGANNSNCHSYCYWDYLEQRFSISHKQIKLASNIFLLSDDNRLFVPFRAFGLFNNKYFHENYSVNMFHNPDDITIRVLIELLGSFFILLVYAQYLPLSLANQPIPYKYFNTKLISEIFDVGYVRPLFKRFLGILSNSSLQNIDNINKYLFIVKDPEKYIIHLRKKSQQHISQFEHEALHNERFIKFISSLPKDEYNLYPLIILLDKYALKTNDYEWSGRMQDLLTEDITSYLITWSTKNISILDQLGFAPEVYLNIFPENMPLYNYKKINDINDITNIIDVRDVR